jgi:hypothetical protein
MRNFWDRRCSKPLGGGRFPDRRSAKRPVGGNFRDQRPKNPLGEGDFRHRWSSKRPATDMFGIRGRQNGRWQTFSGAAIQKKAVRERFSGLVERKTAKNSRFSDQRFEKRLMG